MKKKKINLFKISDNDAGMLIRKDIDTDKLLKAGIITVIFDEYVVEELEMFKELKLEGIDLEKAVRKILAKDENWFLKFFNRKHGGK